jgi:starvation-inducible DNA-binding protein
MGDRMWFDPLSAGNNANMETITTPRISPHTSVPGLSDDGAGAVIRHLEDRLAGSLDLQLALKHIHWNVVGPNFIAVHEMLDTQVDAARAMSDAIAERIATLGGTPQGTPGSIIDARTWDDYPIGRGSVAEHLAALDSVYDGMISDHRTSLGEIAKIDPITEDMLIGQTAELELFQWFVRSHIEAVTAR